MKLVEILKVVWIENVFEFDNYCQYFRDFRLPGCSLTFLYSAEWDSVSAESCIH